jgi:glutaredoxin
MKPIIFTQADCPKCELLKQWAKGKGIEFEERPVPELFGDEKSLELLAVFEKQGMSTPVVLWDDRAMTAEDFKREVLVNG